MRTENQIQKRMREKIAMSGFKNMGYTRQRKKVRVGHIFGIPPLSEKFLKISPGKFQIYVNLIGCSMN